MELRPYQREAVAAVHKEWEEGHLRTLLGQATGTGKTVEFSIITNDQVGKGERVLQLAHREELLTQAADKLKATTGLDSVIEKAGSSALGSPLPVTVASIQSLSQPKRLERFDPDYYQTIICDEAHHALSDSYQRVLLHFPKAKVLGVTATPDRGDKRNLGEYFDSMAYEYPMSKAIKDGWLVPITAQLIPLELDISKVKVSNGDFSVNDIGYALEPYLEQIADEMVTYCKDRKTVVFLPLITTSRRFCEMLKRRGLKAAEVNGQSDDRHQVLDDFANGGYDILCNSMLLTEGWDAPFVDCVVILRPTKLRGLYQQMVGRGTRLSPETGKKDLLLLDFLFLTERHDLCKPSSLISKDQAIADRIDKMMKENPEGVDIIEAEEQAERDAVAEREETLARQLAEMRGRKRKQVDPLQYALSIDAEDLVGYVPSFAWEMAPPSVKQLKFLEGRGIFAESVPNAGMASMLIDKLIRRQDEGLATPKQIRCLEKYGFRKVGTWLFDDASRMISILAGNSWRLPRGVVPATYRP